MQHLSCTMNHHRHSHNHLIHLPFFFLIIVSGIMCHVTCNSMSVSIKSRNHVSSRAYHLSSIIYHLSSSIIYHLSCIIICFYHLSSILYHVSRTTYHLHISKSPQTRLQDWNVQIKPWNLQHLWSSHSFQITLWTFIWVCWFWDVVLGKKKVPTPPVGFFDPTRIKWTSKWSLTCIFFWNHSLLYI